MISALELRRQLAFALDAEGSDHYRDDLDFIPAMNASIKWLTATINSAMSQNKIGEEFFREIAYSGVFKANVHSRISLDVFPNEVWTVLAIYPKPIYSGNPSATADDTISYYMDELVHISSEKDCKRLTVEEWSRNKTNPFEAGYDGNQVCDALKRYAYLAPLNYNNTNSGNTSQEVEVRPSVANDFVTVFWAKKPQVVTDINDNIEFPNSCFQLLFDKSLYYISMKQGDQTTINSISSDDIRQLLSVL